jgi:hypothetical protein
MKLNNKWRSGAVAAIGVTTAALTLGTAGVASAAAGAGQLEICDEANNFTVDAWIKSTVVGQAGPGQCHTISFAPSAQGQVETVSFFIDNQVQPTEIGALTYNLSEGFTVTILTPNEWFWSQTA